MRIARKCNPGKTNYHMMGNVLQEVEDNKYLGVIIQNNLKCDKHSRYAAFKASKLLNFIQRNFHSCSKTVKGN